MLTLFYSTFLVLTTLVWGIVFYQRDYHPQPLRVIWQTFALGLFTLLPVLSYQWIYRSLIPSISEFEILTPLLNSSFGYGLLVFLLNLITLAVVLFLLSSTLVFLFRFFDRDFYLNLKKAFFQESLGFSIVGILLAALIYVQILTQGFFHSVAAGLLGSILFLAIIEEYIKHLIVRLADDKRLKDIDDAITLSIMVGLAFGFSETIIYGFLSSNPEVIFYRSLVTIPVHIIASGIFGYFYGLAHFAKPLVAIEGTSGWMKWKFFKQIGLKRNFLYHEKQMIQGAFWATVFHFGINLLFEFNFGFAAVPFLVIGILILFRFYKMAKDQTLLMQKRFAKKFVKIANENSF